MNIDERAAALAVEISRVTEGKVLTGPFAGMVLPNIIGNASPYFLGTYEHELHDVVNEQIIRNFTTVQLGKPVTGNFSPYKRILNVGCGFGYYACGLARALKDCSVTAIDVDPICRKTCEEMAELNSLTNVKVDSVCNMANDCDLLIMDIEGAEEEKLQPSKADVLVECHECMKPGITQKIIDRFEATHKIDIIHNKVCFFNLEQIFPATRIEHFDHAIATWEGRAGDTPWLWMVRKNDVAA